MSTTAIITARSQRPILTLLWLTVTVAVLDLSTKAVVERWAALRRLPFIYLIDNSSYTMGVGGSGGWYLPALSAVMITTACWWVAPVIQSGRVRPWPMGLAIGGAAGNLVDRTLHGRVTDFLATPWIIVNVADLAVVAGLLAVGLSGGWRRLSPTARSATVHELARRQAQLISKSTSRWT